MKRALSLLSILLLSSTLFAADVEQATLDQILAEIKSLNEKVSALEARLAKYEEVSEVPNAVPPAAVAYAAANPPPKGDKNKWYENLRIELRKAEVRASGDWVNPDAWDKLALKMKPEEVVAILGEPMDKKFSIRKDTDEIFIYRGDLDGQGNTVKGEVRIYKGKVNKILAPSF
jgi:ABC-type multidrug transport system fused ATPase/permease subunit